MNQEPDKGEDNVLWSIPKEESGNIPPVETGWNDPNKGPDAPRESKASSSKDQPKGKHKGKNKQSGAQNINQNSPTKIQSDPNSADKKVPFNPSNQDEILSMILASQQEILNSASKFEERLSELEKRNSKLSKKEIVQEKPTLSDDEDLMESDALHYQTPKPSQMLKFGDFNQDSVKSDQASDSKASKTDSHKASDKAEDSKSKISAKMADNGDGDPSSSDSDSDSSEDKKDKKDSKDGKAKKGKPKKPRDSMLKRISAEADIARTKVRYTAPAPKHDIFLSVITVNKVIRFINLTTEYEIAHGLVLPVSTLLSEKAREQIMAHNPGLTLTEFFKLNTEKLIQMLLKEVIPKSPLAFRKALQDHDSFELPHGYRPRADDFRPFYDALNIKKFRWTRIYEILSTDNEVNIPPITNKEGGLIKVYLDSIPFNYGHRVYETMKETKFKDMYVFLKKFYKIVQQHFEYFENAKQMNQHFGGTQMETPTSNSLRKAKPVFRQRFQNVESAVEDTEAFTEFFPRNEDSSSPDTVPSIKVKQQDEDAEVQVEVQNEQVEDAEELDIDAEIQELSAFNAAGKPPFKPGFKSNSFKPAARFPPNTQGSKDKSTGRPPCCFRLLFYGECEKGDKCDYKHDWNTCAAGHAYYSDLLSNSKYKPKNSILKRPDSLNMLSPVPSGIVDEHYYNSLHNTFLQNVPMASIAKIVHQEVIVITNGNKITVDKTLFDSGAVHASYVSRRFIQKFGHLLELCRHTGSNRVVMGDGLTTNELNEFYRMEILITDNQGNEYTGVVDFWVLESANYDMILGFPAIITHFSEVFKKMIDAAVEQIGQYAFGSVSSVNNLEHTELRFPWTVAPDKEAPEDTGTPLPCSFTAPLNYMEMGYEESLKVYLDEIESHVFKAFAENTNIIQLLKSKGVKVFVPQNWEGIKGIPEVTLVLKEPLPDRLKPKARPVNPKLFEAAKKEFERLRKYFYRESISPIASPLVIAPKATNPFIRFAGDYSTLINKLIAIPHYPIPDVLKALEKIVLFCLFVDLEMSNSIHQF